MENKDIWFVLKSGEKDGPYCIEDIYKMIGLNLINPKTFLWKPGLSNWMPANSFQDLIKLDAAKLKPQSQVNELLSSSNSQLLISA